MLMEMLTVVDAVLLLREAGGSEGEDLYHRPCQLDVLTSLHYRSSLDVSKEANIDD